MAASAVGWRAACAAWGEPARPGLPRRGNGKGEIGLKGFRSLLSQVSFQTVTMILETPKKGVKDE